MTMITTRYRLYVPRRRRRSGDTSVDIVPPTVNDATGTWRPSAITHLPNRGVETRFMFWNVRNSARGHFTQAAPHLHAPIGAQPMSATAWYRATGPGNGDPGSTVFTEAFSDDRDDFFDETPIEGVDPSASWHPPPDDDLVTTESAGARIDAKNRMELTQEFEHWLPIDVGSPTDDILTVDQRSAGGAMAAYRTPLGGADPGEVLIIPEGGLIIGDITFDGQGIIIGPNGEIMPIPPFEGPLQDIAMALTAHEVVSSISTGEDLSRLDLKAVMEHAQIILRAFEGQPEI